MKYLLMPVLIALSYVAVLSMGMLVSFVVLCWTLSPTKAETELLSWIDVAEDGGDTFIAIGVLFWVAAALMSVILRV